MFISYDLMASNLKKYSAEKLNSVVLASNVKGNLKYFVSLIVSFFIFAMITGNYIATMVLYISYVIAISIVISNRKVGFGINDKMLFF